METQVQDAPQETQPVADQPVTAPPPVDGRTHWTPERRAALSRKVRAAHAERRAAAQAKLAKNREKKDYIARWRKQKQARLEEAASKGIPNPHVVSALTLAQLQLDGGNDIKPNSAIHALIKNAVKTLAQ